MKHEPFICIFIVILILSVIWIFWGGENYQFVGLNPLDSNNIDSSYNWGKDIPSFEELKRQKKIDITPIIPDIYLSPNHQKINNNPICINNISPNNIPENITYQLNDTLTYKLPTNITYKPQENITKQKDNTITYNPPDIKYNESDNITNQRDNTITYKPPPITYKPPPITYKPPPNITYKPPPITYKPPPNITYKPPEKINNVTENKKINNLHRITKKMEKNDKKFISRGERTCLETMEKIYGLPFESIWPEWLRNPETGEKLELDCYNDELKIAVEYNGEQHYKWPNFTNQSYEQFINQVRRDRLKIDLCDKNGIYLIIVPYHVKNEMISSYIISLLPETIKKILTQNYNQEFSENI